MRYELTNSKKEAMMSGDHIQYPETAQEEVVGTVHGEEVRDMYRWLEDENDPKVMSWVEEQNANTDFYMESINVEPIYEELLEENDIFARGTPFRRGERYYWYERQPGQQHFVLFSALDAGTEADKQVVFDVNELSDDGSVSLSFFQLSHQGTRAIYATQESGTEYDRIYIKDMATNEETEFYYGRVFSASWRDDETGFYYMRSDYESHSGDETDESHYQQVYFHKIGENRSEDKLVFDAAAAELPKAAWLSAHDSEDGRFIAVNVAIGSSDRRIFLCDTENDTIEELLTELDSRSSLRLLDGYCYLTTDYDANNRQVLRVETTKATELPINEWEVFVPEDSERHLEGWGVTRDEMLLLYSFNVTDQVERIDRKSGSSVGPLDIPRLASIAALCTNRDDENFYYGVTTFLSPSSKYFFDAKKQASSLFYEDERSLDPERYSVEQRWYESKDGERIPMFLIASADYGTKNDNPTLMSGYGGFNISRGPAYVGGLKPWLERGGVVAKPSIRGGGEFGEAWHRAGMRENKQNSFDDFIAAAEYLIDEGITNSERLAIRGGSNGGLLVGAVITQRPELFRAAICSVPLLDMYRYHKFLLAHRWTYEYGDPENADEFEWIKQYSPYHHVDDNQRYPDLLLTAGINDTRVHPMHAWKMAAKLQGGHRGNFTLLKTEMAAGHGPGKGFYQAVHDSAEEIAFIMDRVGMRLDI